MEGRKKRSGRGWNGTRTIGVMCSIILRWTTSSMTGGIFSTCFFRVIGLVTLWTSGAGPILLLSPSVGVHVAYVHMHEYEPITTTSSSSSTSSSPSSSRCRYQEEDAYFFDSLALLFDDGLLDLQDGGLDDLLDDRLDDLMYFHLRHHEEEDDDVSNMKMMMMKMEDPT